MLHSLDAGQGVKVVVVDHGWQQGVEGVRGEGREVSVLVAERLRDCTVRSPAWPWGLLDLSVTGLDYLPVVISPLLICQCLTIQVLMLGFDWQGIPVRLQGLGSELVSSIIRGQQRHHHQRRPQR